MSFQGSLAELSLPDVIQLVAASGKTGCFHLTDNDLKGQIYLHEGRIVHAQVDDLSGEEAVYQLAIWSRGDFVFETGASVAANTVEKTNTNLLMEAARRHDEWRVLQKKVPSMDLVPEFVIPEGPEGQINLNTGEWLILSKIDGRRSIKAIANASSHSTFDTCKILYGLIATNLIRLREPGVPAPHATPPAPAATPVVPRGTAAPPQEQTPIRHPGEPPEGGKRRDPGTAKGAQHVASPTGVVSASPPSLGGGKPPGTNELLQRLLRIRDIANALLGTGGEAIVQKHVAAARQAIEGGAGADAIEQAIQQIASAAASIKGPKATDIVLDHLRAAR